MLSKVGVTMPLGGGGGTSTLREQLQSLPASGRHLYLNSGFHRNRELNEEFIKLSL